MKNKCFIGSLLISALVLFGIWNHDSVARLVSGVVSHNHSSSLAGGGTLSLSGSLSSIKACESGYTRVTPNYCIRNALTFSGALGDFVCTSVAAPASDAKSVDLAIVLTVHSNNAIANRNTTVATYSQAACSSQSGEVQLNAREFVATVAGTVIASVDGFMTAPVVAGNFMLLESSNPASGFATYGILGYSD